MIIKYAQIRPEEMYLEPKRQHEDDAGFDLAVSRYVQIFPGQNAHLCTNIGLAIPRTHFGVIVPRSSTLVTKGLHVSLGVIDPGYRGEVMIVAKNLSEQMVPIHEGERVAQLLILPWVVAGFKMSPKLDEGSRGRQGFGSTGA